MSSSANQRNSSSKSPPSYAAAAATNVNRMKTFPLRPRVPASKRHYLTFSPSSSMPSQAQSPQSSSNVNNIEASSTSINDASTDAIVVSKSLAEQVAKFEVILQRLEHGYTAMQTRVADLEKEAEEAKHQHLLLESRVSFLEEENERLFERVDTLYESNVSANDNPLMSVPEENSPCPTKLQAEIEQLKQST